jgi:hypothetical protein
MNHIYPHKWASACGEAATDGKGELTEVASTWARGLFGLQGKELAAGLERCVNIPDGWPPSLPKFKALCRPPEQPKEEIENAGMYTPAVLALPEPKEMREQRCERKRKAMNGLRAALNSTTGTTVS